MGLFNWIIPKKILQQYANSVFQYWISNGTVNVMNEDTGEFLRQGYQGNISVYSIIDRIDKMRQQSKMRLYQKKSNGDSEEVTGHDLNKFLYKINPDTTYNEFVTQFLIYRLICGENFIYAPRLTGGLNSGKVHELRVLPASDIDIIEGTPIEPIRGFKLQGGTYEKEFSKDDVYHSKLFNPLWYRDGTLHGLSPLVAANKTVSKLNEADTTELKQLENQGPKYALFRKTNGNTIPHRLSSEQQSEIEDRFDKYSKERRGKIEVLKEEMGKLELGTNVADMALKELTEQGVIALCAQYGMPAELFGYGQKTYNNMETARKAAWTDCVMPNMDIIADVMNACLIYGTTYENEGYYYKNDYSEVEELQDGMNSKIEWMNAAGVSMNEVREAAGFGRIDNPLMDEPRVPSMTMFLSELNSIPDEGKSFEDYLKVDNGDT